MGKWEATATATLGLWPHGEARENEDMESQKKGRPEAPLYGRRNHADQA
jgi:hypothetical protein